VKEEKAKRDEQAQKTVLEKKPHKD
jgi:hypothetical protein